MSGLSFRTATALWGRYPPYPTLDSLQNAAKNHAQAEGIGPYPRRSERAR